MNIIYKLAETQKTRDETKTSFFFKCSQVFFFRFVIPCARCSGEQFDCNTDRDEANAYALSNVRPCVCKFTLAVFWVFFLLQLQFLLGVKRTKITWLQFYGRDRGAFTVTVTKTLVLATFNR